MQQYALSASAFLYHADCRDALRLLPNNSIDSVVTDPPYEIGFMGKAWDNRGIANDPVLWAEVFRVLKPGGHVAAFGASRGYHRMACAIEDAGFEIRDSLCWLYGCGFPKSHDVSKGIDKANGKHERNLQPFGDYVRACRVAKDWTLRQFDEAMGTNTAASWWEGRKSGIQPPGLEQYRRLKSILGMDDRFDELIDWLEAEREVVGQKTSGIANKAEGVRHTIGASSSVVVDITAPATDAARQWEGWGTALKPAFEPIVLARKPLSEGTVAANVLRWRTGALNIDGTRIHTEGSEAKAYTVKRLKPGATLEATGGKWKQDDVEYEGMTKDGRWPANVVHDGSDEVVEAFPQSNGPRIGNPNERTKGKSGMFKAGEGVADYRDSGSAARFFYSAKASKADRAGSKHPTVKPIALMEWLATLITPPGGTILDPFAGSGTTGAAARNKGFNIVLCERETEYIVDIRARFGVPRVIADAPSLVPAPPY